MSELAAIGWLDFDKLRREEKKKKLLAKHPNLKKDLEELGLEIEENESRDPFPFAL